MDVTSPHYQNPIPGPKVYFAVVQLLIGSDECVETRLALFPGKGILPEKLGGGAAPKALAIFPALLTCPKFDILFITVVTGTNALNIIYERLLSTVLAIIMKKKNALSKKNQFKTRVQEPYPIFDQNGQTRYSLFIFITKTAEKLYPSGSHILI